MNKLTVYNQMTSSPSDLFNVLKQEIGIKTNCIPFAVKAITALSSLGKLTEGEALNAANVFLDNLQTLNQGGITAEDYDKIDFVKRGKTICVTARVEAFYRAAARKGYRITDSIIGVPLDDSNTTYFEENFYNGEFVYNLKDRRIQGDRKITADRLIHGYFGKFICRLEVVHIESNKRIVMTTCEMSNDEMLSVAAVSEQGLYKTRWEKYKKDNGYEGNRKIITDELNSGTIWTTWTTSMVEKSIIRRALKRVREVLPELKDTIYAFDNDSTEVIQPPEEIPFEIPMETVNVDLEKLTEDQKADVKETLDLFKANPKLASDKANEIKGLLDSGDSLQSVINTHYASIINIHKSKKLYPIIRPYFESAAVPEQTTAPSKPEAKPKPATTPAATPPAQTPSHVSPAPPPPLPPRNGYLFCAICDMEITSEKSKKYYADHPDKEARCWNCREVR